MSDRTAISENPLWPAILTRTLEALVSRGETGRPFRRLLKDSGDAGLAATELANKQTQEEIHRQTVKYDITIGGQDPIRPGTFELIFSKLTWLRYDNLIRTLHKYGGEEAKIGADIATKHGRNPRLKELLKNNERSRRLNSLEEDLTRLAEKRCLTHHTP